MMSRSRLLLALLTLSGVVVSLPATAGASTTSTSASTTSSTEASNPLVRPHQFAPHGAPRGSTALGAVPGTQRLSLSVVLPPSNTAGLHSLLANLYNPSSPQFHQWLKPGQFATEFGPSSSDVATVESWLHERGLSSTARSGSAINVSASVSKVSVALGTSFERYRLRSGQVGYLAHDAPLVPDNLAHGQVASIIGLNTLTNYRPEALKSVSSDRLTSNASLQPMADGLNPCSGATTALANFGTGASLDQIGASYGISSLLNDNQNGHGETIGLYELAPHSASDVSSYLSCFGLANSVSTVPVDGGSFTDPGGEVEADLDIEQAATQAPGASIVSYEGPNSTQGVYDVWSTIVSDDVAQVVSTSWGECEAIALQDGMSGGFSTLFTQAAMQGQSIFAATGDSGSEDCYPTDGSTSLAVDYPASDPGVTAVGGTTLGTNSEVVWNDCQRQEATAACGEEGVTGATGGGVSAFETRQSDQPVVDVPAEVSCLNGCREVPDVSANAGTPMEIYCLQAGCSGGWAFARGTSFAAPLWAGLAADRSDGCTAQTGLFNPALYALYGQGAYGSAFTDITSGSGDNDLIGGGTNIGQYPALSGYDLASGIGSPIAGGLSCPEVTSVTPGQSGDQVVVSGLGLEHATIDFGGSAASVVPGTASATAVTVVVPSGSGTVTVGGTSVLGTGTNTWSFTYPAITTTSLGAGVVGQPYSQTLTAVGVSAPESWTATPGSLPAGLGLNSSSGVISGTPTTAVSSQNVSITLTADQNTVLTATLPIRIFSSASTTTATVTPSNSDLGSSVTFRADVTSSSGTPTGTVTFSIGSTPLCTTPALVSGIGSCASTAAPAGSNTVTATYSDDATFAPSTGSTSLVVADGPYSPLAPVRICDTRPNNPSNLTSITGAPANQCNGQNNIGSTLAAGGTKSIAVAGDFGVPSGATAVVLNVTVVNPTAPGYLSVYPKGAAQPMASNIDYVTGQVVPNLVEVGTGTAGEVTFYASTPTDIVVDVEGYTSLASAGLYTALSDPVRICDTRAGDPSMLDSAPVNQCNGANNAGATLGAGGTRNVQVTGISTIPAGATAAVLNVTDANPAAPGYMTVYPQGGVPPTASNLNYVAGQVTDNRVIVPLSASGGISVYSSAGADVIVDVSGYYSAGTGTEFNAEPAPVRICDTRAGNPSSLTGSSTQCNGNPVSPGQSRIVNVSGLAGVPITAKAVAVNVIGVNPSAPTFLTVFPNALPSPLVSDLNEIAGDVRANMAVATLSSTGTITIFNYTGSVNVVVDVLGWYS
jgi:hypothetical protein